eukprot:606978-Pyramimonas_sp.AAC.2
MGGRDVALEMRRSNNHKQRLRFYIIFLSSVAAFVVIVVVAIAVAVAPDPTPSKFAPDCEKVAVC